jgi:hypothetical protein
MKKLGRGLLQAIGAALYKVFIATLTVAFIGGGIAALANYTATQGAGTTFGSVVVSTVHYAQMMLCDLTTPSQCAAVSAAGAVKVDGSAVTQTVSGTVTANAGTNLNTSTLATSANQTNASQKSQLVDGSGNVATTQQANGHVAVDTVINDVSGNRLNGLTTGTFGTPSTQVVSVITAPSSSAVVGITPVVGGSAISSLVLKASTGNLYGIYAECSSACWLMVFNSTTVPSNGSTTAGVASGNLVECIPILANSSGSITYAPGPPAIYSVGMTAAISSTTCATLTLSAVGFIHGLVM